MIHIALINPKKAYNVGQVVRSASVYGVDKVLMTGTRVELEGRPGYRLPREERYRGYLSVTPSSRIFDDSPGLTPVAVELVHGTETLPLFEHPKNALYVFGPEDGGLSPGVLSGCHRFVSIPGLHCSNLAIAVANVLYDRHADEVRSGAAPLALLSD